MRRELGRMPERVAVGIDQRAAESRGQRRLVEPERLEEVGKARGGGHLTMIDRPQALGLAPALAERLVAALEGDFGRLLLQDRMEQSSRRAHDLAVDLDLRHALAVEADEGVEQVEQDRGVRHQSGFLPA